MSQTPRAKSRRPVRAVALTVAIVFLAWMCGVRPGLPDLTGEPDAAKLPAPQVASADPVPVGQVIRRLPAGCGLSKPTLGVLLAGPSSRKSDRGDFGRCEWSDAYRTLQIEFNVFLEPRVGGEQPLQIGTVGSPPVLPGKTGTSANQGKIKTTPTAAAIDHLRQLLWPETKTEALPDLGDEGVGQFSSSSGGRVQLLFRVGNVNTKVVYTGFRESKGKSQDAAKADALRAAGEVARSLGATGRPATSEAGPSSRKEPPDVCQLVSDGTLRKVIKDFGSPQRGSGSLRLREDSETATCSWGSKRHLLGVSLMAVSDSKGESGPQRATRDYLKLHHDARAEDPITRDGAKYFSALTGLGQQAFGAYVEEGAPGRVIFRRGNLLAHVVYTTADTGKPLTKEQTINGAYAVAAYLVGRLPG